VLHPLETVRSFLLMENFHMVDVHVVQECTVETPTWLILGIFVEKPLEIIALISILDEVHHVFIELELAGDASVLCTPLGVVVRARTRVLIPELHF
jgi:hypothetical protein